MEISSPDFDHNTLIPSQFTCDGEDINPNIDIHGVPTEAETLALIVEDPDAPEGIWTHWLLWNIDPSEERITSAATPIGSVEGTTSFGRPGYGGPCPPSGTHRYFFRLHALSRKLDLPVTATVDELREAMEGAVLEECELVGLYSRNGG